MASTIFESHLHCPSREVVDFISICKPLKVIECPAIRLGGLPGLMLWRNLKDCERVTGRLQKLEKGSYIKGAQRPWVESFVWYYVLDKGDAQRL